jgi:serine phosphatase RsbU (regulator of sigma subunit)
MKTGREQRREAGKVFGVERLREMVSAAGGLDAQGLRDLIRDHVEHFQAEAVQHDDIALLELEATMEGSWQD